MKNINNGAFHLLAWSCIILFFLTGNAAGSEPKQRYTRTVEKYTVPDVTLINQNGSKIRLRSFLNSDRTVILDFIYGTCTTICPILSAGYANLQNKLGADSAKVRLVSISIDPEHDTPEVMKSYLKRYNAKSGWDFLTGSREDINAVMKAFDAYVLNKMSHYPLTLLRAPDNDRWVRIYGLISTSDFMTEYQRVFRR
ncbi:MAG: SCO family protein [Nitrospirae bacterium]|nr:SCO family protein [Nitrospirota bacterium]